MKKTLILKRLLSYTQGATKYMFLSVATSIFTVIFNLLSPLIIGKGIDNVVGVNEVNFEGLNKYIIILIVVIAFGSVVSWFQGFTTAKLSHLSIQAIRNDLFRKLNKVPISYIDSNSHGDIMNMVINDVDQISSGLLQGFSQVFTGICTIIGTLFFMFYLNVVIAIIVVVLTPISLVVANFIAKGNHKNHLKQMAYRGEMSGFVEEMISNIKVVSAFNYNDKALEKIEELNEPLYSTGVKSHFFSAIVNPCTRFVNGLVYASVGTIGAIAVVTGFGGSLTVGILTSFLTYASQYTKPFNEISGVIAELQAAFASAIRIFELLDSDELSSDANSLFLEENNGSVTVKDVYFSYTPDKPLIQDFSIDVKNGQKIAIVGPTGCGKTTLINLLMRFYDVNSGKILVSGYDIRDLKRSSLRKQYGMVLQESWLFKGTIKENIMYGKPDASLEEVIAAAKLSHAHSFIKRLEHGYDTFISEGGENISEGQKQLLCITRIMLQTPPILILDEATSSIDTRTEAQIQKAFDKIMNGRTTFIVAHRLSTITSSDKIIVMNKGNIVEIGSHLELLEKNGFYASIYNSQFDTSNRK